jgi:hypothetical protein
MTVRAPSSLLLRAQTLAIQTNQLSYELIELSASNTKPSLQSFC